DRVCRHAGEGVTAATLHTYDEGGQRAGGAHTPVQNKQLFLCGFHDGADHAVESDICSVLQGDQSNVVVLPLEPAVLYGNESVGEGYVGLEFLTAQADKQRAPAEVGVAGN